jgi:hypothetical protein
MMVFAGAVFVSGSDQVSPESNSKPVGQLARLDGSF